MDDDVDPIILDLRQSADDSAVEVMTSAVEAVHKRHGDADAAGTVWHALAAIAEAVQEHELAEIRNGASPPRLLRLLRHAIKQPERAAELIARADPSISSPARAHLWSAAQQLGRVRVEASDEGKTTLLLAGGDWHPLPRSAASWSEWIATGQTGDPWLVILGADKAGFREVADRAIKVANEERTQPDFLRQFRDLARDPTRRKLANILERDRNELGLGVCEPAIGRAIWDLKLLGSGDVPDDWIDRVADDRDMVAKIARQVCKRFGYREGSRGPRPDLLLAQYANRVAKAYGDIVGRPITYTRTTEVHDEPNLAYGLGLEFMLAALRLVDPGLSKRHAVEHIDRIRGWSSRDAGSPAKTRR